MKFFNVVPKDATLTVVTGMPGLEDQEGSYGHDLATKAADKWNYGVYHPDVWMEIYYDDGSGRQGCHLLYDDDDQKVIGFIYGDRS